MQKRRIIAIATVVILLTSLINPAIFARDNSIDATVETNIELSALIAKAEALNKADFSKPVSTWAKPWAAMEAALAEAKAAGATEQSAKNLKDALDWLVPDNGRPKASTNDFKLDSVNMVDPDATKETKSLFAYLKNSSQGRVMFGHQGDGSVNGSGSDTYKNVGSSPAVVGVNFSANMTAGVRDLYNKGVIVEVNNHGSNLAVVGSGYNNMSDLESVAKVLPGYAVNNPDSNLAYGRLIAYLDEVAASVKNLTVSDADNTLIPVIFRPWHEHNGDWFWWDCTTATEGEYKELFRFTVEYLRDVKEVHNLIYAFSPNGHYATREEYLYAYPGDDIIDILGIDIYWDGPHVNPNWWSQLTNDMRIVSAYAKETGKIAALTEFGLRWCAGSNGLYHGSANDYTGWGESALYGKEWFTRLRNAIINDDEVQIAYMSTWTNQGMEQFWVPYRGYEGVTTPDWDNIDWTTIDWSDPNWWDNLPTVFTPADLRDAGDHEMLPDFIKYYNQDDVVFADRIGVGTPYKLDVKASVPLPASVRIEAPVFKEIVKGSYRALVYPRPEKGDGIASVTIQIGGGPVVAAASYSAGTFNKYYSAVIDTTAVQDGRVPVKATLTTTSGKAVTEVQDIFVRNGAVPVIDYTRVIDDFESYDDTDDNRTDLNRTWARASNAGSLPSGWNTYIDGADSPDMNALRLRPSIFVEGGTMLQMKYDNLNQNRANPKQFGSSIIRRFVPIGNNIGVDWSGNDYIGFWVKPDSKNSELCLSIIVGAGGAANYYRADYAALNAYGFDKAKHNVAQYIRVPLTSFKNNGTAISKENLKHVTGFSIAIYGDKDKPVEQRYMSGLNDLEYYLFDEIMVYNNYLEVLIAKAEALKLADFSNPASTWAKPWAAMQTALTAAKAALAADSVTQPVIDNLKDAIDWLVPDNGRDKVSTDGFALDSVNMVDPDATEETKSLFAYLKNSSEGHVLFGHQQDTTSGVSGGNQSDTFKDVNTYPAVVGLNFATNMLNSVRNLYNNGIITEINAHGGNAASGGNMATNSGYGNMADLESVSKVLPGYSINAENATYYNRLITYLDNVANTVKGLTVSATDNTLIPVIYRPWHEHNGDWFWWDCTTATEGEYKELFRFTVEYLRDIKGVHNIIYAFSPNGHYADLDEYLYGYPGDDIIDILGIDIYWDGPHVNKNWWIQLQNDMRIVSAYAKKTGKIAALTEFGLRWCAGGNGLYYPTANSFTGWGTTAPYGTEWFTKLRDAISGDDGVQMAYMATWANFTGMTQFWVPYRGYSATGAGTNAGDHEMLPDFIKYYNQDDVVFADRLGNENLYKLNVGASVPLPASVKVEAPVFKEIVKGSYKALVYPRPEKDDGIASVTIQLGDGPVVAAEPYSAGAFNKYYSAVIDTTAVQDGRVPVKATLTTTKGKVVTEIQDVFVRNGAVPVIDYTRVIDDFESYDNTDDNRTDLNRTWARASNAGSLPSGWNAYVYGTDTPDMNALRLRPSIFTEGGTMLQLKYDNLNQNRATQKYFGSQIVRRFVPIGTNTGVNWSVHDYVGFWVKPDSKNSELCLSIIVGAGGNNNYFRARYADLKECGFDKTLHNTAQYVKVPFSKFKNNSGVSISAANLANVTGFSIAIYGDSDKPVDQRYMSGLNDLEYYLFDDIKVCDYWGTDVAKTVLGNTLAVTGKVSNDTAIGDTAMVTAAVYTSGNKLVALSTQNVTVAAGATEALKPFTFDLNGVAKDYVVRVFTWRYSDFVPLNVEITLK